MIQMTAKSTIFFFVALLPSIIYGDRFINTYLKYVKKKAKEGGRIECIFQPEGEKSLGYGDGSFVYAGILFPSEAKIAMKFTLSEHISIAKKEYEMYTYLDAINNPTVERYGIPSVYYFGEWTEHSLVMMGMSLLDENINKLWLLGKMCENDVSHLIIIRDFILSSKYMHSHGVRHDDIKPTNIMVRGHRSFLIDFNLSSKMNEKNKRGSNDYLSRRGHTNGERYPKDDWESFLYSFCDCLGTDFEWLGHGSKKGIYRMKLNTNATIEKIEQLESEIMRKIMIELAEHIFDDGGEGADVAPFYNTSNLKRFPDYDYFYKLVNEEIEKLNLPPPATFTWLSPEDTREAVNDFNKHGIPDITKISDPKDYDFPTKVVDFRKFLPEIAIDIRDDENAPSLHRSRGAASSSECRVL